MPYNKPFPTESSFARRASRYGEFPDFDRESVMNATEPPQETKDAIAQRIRTAGAMHEAESKPPEREPLEIPEIPGEVWLPVLGEEG